MRPSTVFQELVRVQKSGVPAGICSVCSSHPWVLRAAMAEGRRQGNAVLIESTVNQVNQDGGYSGMVPAEFRDLVHKLAGEVGLPPERVLLGADHLGPYPWAGLPAEAALEKACVLAADLVRAGYVKIHLDASLPLRGDEVSAGRGLDPRLVAQRQARIAAAAEAAFSHGVPPVYVIGSDVPAPGGTTLSPAIGITSPEAFAETIDACRDAFWQAGLASVWERVLAVVVELGAEFGDSFVQGYDRARAQGVCAAARSTSQFVLEAHSTDYQQPAALRQMVEDGAAILKVGPALTFALRETLFGLEHVEAELCHRLPEGRSNLRRALEQAMDADPRHWRGHFGPERDKEPGARHSERRADPERRGHPERREASCRRHDPREMLRSAQNDAPDAELRLARTYSLFDRCRYYWSVPEVAAAVRRLVANLRQASIPLSLLSQYCPAAAARIRRGELPLDPEAIVRQQICEVLAAYAFAVK